MVPALLSKIPPEKVKTWGKVVGSWSFKCTVAVPSLTGTIRGLTSSKWCNGMTMVKLPVIEILHIFLRDLLFQLFKLMWRPYSRIDWPLLYLISIVARFQIIFTIIYNLSRLITFWMLEIENFCYHESIMFTFITECLLNFSRRWPGEQIILLCLSF